LADQIISLPLHTRLAAGQIEQVITKVSQFLRSARPAVRRGKLRELNGAIS
jgi:hypothetical protein